MKKNFLDQILHQLMVIELELKEDIENKPTASGIAKINRLHQFQSK